MEHRSIVERAKKHDTVMKNVAKILYILLSFWLRFWANIGLPYSKSAIMSTRKSLECKTKAWRIKFQQYRTLAAVKRYTALSIWIPILVHYRDTIQQNLAIFTLAAWQKLKLHMSGYLHARLQPLLIKCSVIAFCCA